MTFPFQSAPAYVRPGCLLVVPIRWHFSRCCPGQGEVAPGTVLCWLVLPCPWRTTLGGLYRLNNTWTGPVVGLLAPPGPRQLHPISLLSPLSRCRVWRRVYRQKTLLHGLLQRPTAPGRWCPGRCLHCTFPIEAPEVIAGNTSSSEALHCHVYADTCGGGAWPQCMPAKYAS